MSLPARADFAEYDRLLASTTFSRARRRVPWLLRRHAFVNDAHVHLLYVHGGLLSRVVRRRDAWQLQCGAWRLGCCVPMLFYDVRRPFLTWVSPRWFLPDRAVQAAQPSRN